MAETVNMETGEKTTSITERKDKAKVAIDEERKNDLKQSWRATVQ